MHIQELHIEGVKLLHPKIFRDERGFFIERYQKSRFEEAGVSCEFVQDNHSFSHYKVLRGMHYQEGEKQAKLVYTVSGRIYDVVVDMRAESPTLGKWLSILLDDREGRMLFIPPGCAHGFCVLSREAHVAYKVNVCYDPAKERGFLWNDPDINIFWPIEQPIISQKDQNQISWKESMVGISS